MDLCKDAVGLSDDASQFAIGRGDASGASPVHALCRVHAERLVHKLDAFTDRHRAAQPRIHKLIWNVYADLKSTKPTQHDAPAHIARPFDRIFRRRTGFVTMDRRLARRWVTKAELLMVLERPDIPPNTDSLENNIGRQVTLIRCRGQPA